MSHNPFISPPPSPIPILPVLEELTNNPFATAEENSVFSNTKAEVKIDRRSSAFVLGAPDMRDPPGNWNPFAIEEPIQASVANNEIDENKIQAAFQQAEALQKKLYPNLSSRQPIKRGEENLDRYFNICSGPAAQVKLSDDSYINASYITMGNIEVILRECGVEQSLLSKINWRGVFRRNYIATQGALPHTIADLWKMILEYRVTEIVMLTKLMEMQKYENGMERQVPKCEQYWSEEDSRVYNPKNTSQRVNHHWFKDWPDHGIPNAEALLKLMQETKEHLDGTPILIHCSAGVGRTGVFILIDMMRRIVSAQKPTELLSPIEKLQLATGLLKYLRTCRTSMVHNLEQWKFSLEFIGVKIDSQLKFPLSLEDIRKLPQFYGTTSSGTINPLLTGKPTGTYLLRESAQEQFKGKIILSLMTASGIGHPAYDPNDLIIFNLITKRTLPLIPGREGFTMSPLCKF